ncbi:uncharacterized protein PFLUO_LOCUS389 [Penicillium psychrofluorescens]|uniref:uncharacterized protein n=1 Tax=Penicillium psychrofluorescens TaxID=3158075 RepID=UPI003CCD986B
MRLTWHNWVDEVIAAFAWTRTQFGGQAGALVNDFLPTKLPTSDTWVLTLMAGLLGALSGGFAMAIELLPGIASSALLISGAAGVSSGGDTMANGIVTGQLPSAEAVVQNELNSLADVETYVIAQINSTIESINNTATQVLTDPATNDPTNNYYYMSADNSLASILHGGAFASSSVGTGEDLSMYQTAVSRMWDASISFLWQSQNVIIVKLSTDIIGLTGAPCDIQLTKGFQRVCDGDTAYFFGIIGISYSDTTPIYGADDNVLGKYGLNMLGVAQAANATQVKYGFGKYFSNATAQQIMSNAFQSPDELIMTLPFCDLDALYDLWKDTSLVNLENIITKELRLLYIIYNVCGAVTADIDGTIQTWPLDGYGTLVYVDGEIVREGVYGDQGDGAYSAGRGGVGNIGSPSVRPTSRPPHDAEMIPELAMRNSTDEVYHTGRGGQGNVHLDEEQRKEKERKKNPAHEGLADKLKHKLLGKK